MGSIALWRFIHSRNIAEYPWLLNAGSMVFSVQQRTRLAKRACILYYSSSRPLLGDKKIYRTGITRSKTALLEKDVGSH